MGRVFASRLQWLFKTAAAVRDGDESAAERLVSYLSGVPDESVEPIIRACSLELQLANIAEERERVRRRRQYDATGEVQRESLAETAEILRANEIDIAPLAAQLQIEHVLTAHPDRGHAPQRPRPPVGRRRAAGPPRRPAHRPLAPARAARRAARGADAVVADRRAAPDPAARRGRGPPQPVLLRGRPVRRDPGRAGRDRARAGRPARPAGAVLRLLDRRRHGRSPRGRRRHAGDRARRCTARPRCGCSARAWTGSRACSATPACGSRSPRSCWSRSSATPRSCRAPPACAAPTASGSRCGPSWPSSTTGSATR